MYFSVLFQQWTGDTPLHTAIKNGHMQLAEQMISRGADINSSNKVSATYIYTVLFITSSQ